MKILQWAFPYLPVQGGRENFVHDITSEMSHSPHEVMIFAQTHSATDPPYVRDDTMAGCVIHRFNLETLTGPDGANALHVISSAMQSIAVDFAPDVIHFHNVAGRDTLLLKAVKVATGAKVVLTLHLAIDNPTPTYLALLAFPNDLSDAIVAVSRFVFDDFLHYFPELAHRTHLILNGVTQRNASPPPPGGELQVFASGRLSPEKGFPILLSAWSTLLPRIGAARLKIAGEGPERMALERYIRHLGLEGSVELLGWTSRADIAEHLNQSQFVVVPSIWEEPFGLVAAEALMAGRAVVASRTGGLPELIHHRKNGMLVRPGDIFDLSATLYFMATDPTAATTFGAQAYDDALTSFALETCVAHYLALYEEMTST